MSVACRSCQAPIKWIRTTAGKVMPVNPLKQMYVYPKNKGNRVVLEDGKTITIDGSQGKVWGYSPHWATCPQARDWRRQGMGDGTAKTDGAAARGSTLQKGPSRDEQK